MSSQKLSLFSGDDRAVSPVIGVALMIGIVVVLAGAIGFAVLDFGSDVGAEPQASVDVEQIEDDGSNNPQVRVTWVSEGNSDVVRVLDAAGTGNLTAPGESHTITFDGTPSTQQSVSVIAVIEENPENSTAVIETVENPS